MAKLSPLMQEVLRILEAMMRDKEKEQDNEPSAE